MIWEHIKLFFMRLTRWLRRPSCKHVGYLEPDFDLGSCLLMDAIATIECTKCGKKWVKTVYEVMNTDFKEW